MIWLVVGCGYHFAGRQVIQFPHQARTVCIQKIVNPSVYSWLDQTIRDFLSEEIPRRSEAVVVNDTRADLFLSVRIDYISTSQKTKGENDLTLNFEAKVCLELIFKDAKGRVLFRTLPVTYAETYASESEQQQALTKATTECLRRSLDQLVKNEF
ncbi:MAG: LPS assembly lipoprotein LptE [Desulfonauticus sp.]|nr:LPS assembly lipoprotein LptE [Desulfonauticus sp.]